MDTIIERADIRQALEAFAQDGSRKSLSDLGNLCRTNYSALADGDFMYELLEAAKGKDPKVTQLLSHFIKGHIRQSRNLRKTGRNMIIGITGMKKETFYDGKCPLELDVCGDSNLSDKEKVAIHVIGPAFLEDTEVQRLSQFTQDWETANKISFAEEIGIADEYLFSLGRWLTTLAMNCRETLKPNEAKIILTNIERINDIVDEHHYHAVRIPEFLYELSGSEKPTPQNRTLAL